MERIAPLAKILAEANGIDWQQLRGTGDGGMVVEQDILNYLSRIMSGEEEPPATPVDVPPPDWNGDVNAMPDLSGISADQLARAGVESDISELLGQVAAATLSPSVPVTAPADLDDLEFELDDAEPGVPTPAPTLAPTPATPSLGGWEWSAASTLVPATPPLDRSSMAPAADRPTAHQVPDVAAPAVSAPTVQFTAPADATSMAPRPEHTESAHTESAHTEPASVAGAGLGSLLSRLYQQPAQTAAAPAETAPAKPVPVESAPTQMPAMDTPAFNAAMDTDPADVNSGPVLDTGTSWPALSIPEVSVPEVSLPVVDAPEPALVMADEPAAVAAAPQHAAPAPNPVAAAPAPEVAPAAASASQTAGDAVWFGTYLRRDADVGTLSDLHGQIVAALGQELPLGLLVARAAQRHAADLNLDSVALHHGGSARSIAGDTLRAAADAVNYDYQGTPDLLVVDAGAHGLDDLHYPHTTTLSVGRVQEGRAALTLNGSMDAAQGAAFLAAVAHTLGQPVLLLL